MTTDPRLLRPHPDALPSHRLCPDCGRVLPLDSDHFHLNRQRYPWALGRFATYCKPCQGARKRAHYRATKAARNARDTERRRIARANLRTAPPLPAHVQAIARAKAEEARAAKERKALARRQLNRARGPYVDPIKALIRERQAEALRKRLQAPTQIAQAEPLDVEQQDYLGQLEALRSKHRRGAGES